MIFEKGDDHDDDGSSGQGWLRRRIEIREQWCARPGFGMKDWAHKFSRDWTEPGRRGSGEEVKSEWWAGGRRRSTRRENKTHTQQIGCTIAKLLLLGTLNEKKINQKRWSSSLYSWSSIWSSLHCYDIVNHRCCSSADRLSSDPALTSPPSLAAARHLFRTHFGRFYPFVMTTVWVRFFPHPDQVVIFFSNFFDWPISNCFFLFLLFVFDSMPKNPLASIQKESFQFVFVFVFLPI